jgi:hypothetical protein
VKSEKWKCNVKKCIFHRNFATPFTMRMFGNSNNVNGNSIQRMCHVTVPPPPPRATLRDIILILSFVVRYVRFALISMFKTRLIKCICTFTWNIDSPADAVNSQLQNKANG